MSGLVLANVRAHSSVRVLVCPPCPGLTLAPSPAPALARPDRPALSCQWSDSGRHLMFKSDKSAQVHSDTAL